MAVRVGADHWPQTMSTNWQLTVFTTRPTSCGARLAVLFLSISYIPVSKMSKRTGGGASKGNSFRISIAMPVGAVMNCADNSGAKNLYVVAVFGP
jgi:hypothetical protein